MASSALGSLERAPSRDAGKSPRRLPLLDQYLKDQHRLSAVERFAKQHENAKGLPQERFYKDLLPATPPQEGQQYAFQVDLDVCTGCKACVTACHNLNGLDEGETWRAVGLLHGGHVGSHAKQWVTTACHHCLEPACMNGCPVGAYEKDAKTGIVKHLDDQCIGCQYCTFTCPYEVPQYNAKRGIVRKCDMCTDRLSAGEAPACVQACPNEAIAITIVERRQALEDAQGDAFLPGAPSPGITIPTTTYKTERALPRNMLPANFYTVSPSHQHMPLVVMLVLTQLSVGAFGVDAIASRFLPASALAPLRPVHSLVAVAVGLAALGASMFHLGRPAYAFRAFIGLRTSWMSREILAFGLFAPLAVLYAALSWFGPSFAWLADALRALVAFTGLVGVMSSVFIYHATRRAFWSASRTGFQFVMTAIVLGLATTLAAWVSVAPLVRVLSHSLAAASALKLASELLFLRHVRDQQQNDLKRSAILMTRDLARYTVARCVFLAVGGVILPLVHALGGASIGLALASLLLLVLAELLERMLFFAAASSPGMPGALR